LHLAGNFKRCSLAYVPVHRSVDHTALSNGWIA
jgi:hypothetical protein